MPLGLDSVSVSVSVSVDYQQNKSHAEIEPDFVLIWYETNQAIYVIKNKQKDKWLPTTWRNCFSATVSNNSSVVTSHV